MAGLFKDLVKKKNLYHGDGNPVDTYLQKAPYLVVGSSEDPMCVLLWHALKEQYGESHVLAVNTLVRADLTQPWSHPWWEHPELSRGAEQYKALQEIFPESMPEFLENKTLFYKDQKWRSLGGRAKLDGLQLPEDYFLKSPVSWNPKSLLPSDYKERAQEFREKALGSFLDGIERIDSITENTRNVWRVHCSKGSIIDCEHLFYCESPKVFFDLYEQKHQLNETQVEFFRQSSSFGTLVVHFHTSQILFEEKTTLFVPQSQTHDWGYFIGEVAAPKEQNGQLVQELTLFCFMGNADGVPTTNDEMSEEALKKIKLLKRTLHRLFNLSDAVLVQDSLTWMDRNFYDSVEDQHFLKGLNESPEALHQLYFAGADAPLCFLEKDLSEEDFEICELIKRTSGPPRALLLNEHYLRKFCKKTVARIEGNV